MFTRIFFVGAIFIYSLVLWSSEASAQSSPPCPPIFGVNGAMLTDSTECPETTLSVSDTDYGPTQLIDNGNVCPGIPTSFPKTYTVTTASEFNTAASQVQPGEAIIIANGSRGYWNVTIPSGTSGTDSDRVYILSESLYGAQMSTGSRFVIEASNITISGLYMFSNNMGFHIKGDKIRLACNKVDGSLETAFSYAFIYHTHNNPTDFYDDLEVDNNIFENMKYLIYRSSQCQSYLSSCVGVSKRAWFHHNSMVATDARYFVMYYGLAWSPEDLNNPGVDPKNRTENIFENNYVDWYITGGYELMDIKTSANIFRNNCFKNARPMGIRAGNDNLITGNWFSGTGPSPTWMTPGWRNVVVFNYFGNGHNAHPAFDLRYGQDDTRSGTSMLWTYYSTSDGVYSNNVFNKYNRLIRTWKPTGYPLLSPIDKPYPSNNKIQNNIVHSSSYVGDYISYDGPLQNDVRGPRNEAEFIADNPEYNNNIVDANVIEGDPPCGTPGVVNGIGTSVPGLPGLLGSPATIDAPSWW